VVEYSKEDTIFVQIASYRDSELQHTLQDLFAKAKKPENIFVGICHQYDMKEQSDKHLFEIPFPRPNQLRIEEIDFRDAKGISFARNRAQKLWRGEKWSLQVDAHSRFKENWDEELVLAAHNLRGDGNIVFSQCLPSYNIKTGAKSEDCSNRICCTHFVGTYAIPATKEYPPSPNLTILAYGGFMFGLGENLCQTLLNPSFGAVDETPISIRLWTKGVDFYSYNKPIIWHYWPSPEEAEKNEARKKYKLDFTGKFIRSLHDDLFSIKKSSDETIIKMNKEYGFFDARTMRDYERFSGIDFRRKKLREFTKLGIFRQWHHPLNKERIKNIFSNLK